MSLIPGARSTPEETSTPRAPVSAIAAATLSGSRPPERSQGRAARNPAPSPSRRADRCRLAGRVFRRLGVDQQQVRNVLVGPGWAKSSRAETPIAFIVGRAQSSPIRLTRVGFRAMQLHEVGRQGVDDALERVVVGVDGERNDLCASSGLQPESARGLPVDMARALREKYESDHVRAGVKRGCQRRGGRKTADFDDRRHRAPLSVKAPPLSKVRRDQRNGAPGPRGAARSHRPACRPEARSRSMASISACAAARIFASASR